MATIYRKTTKGVQEIEKRTLKLAPRFRSLLILVDGRRSDEELLAMLTSADPQAILALSEGGFVEAIGMTTDLEPPLAPRPLPAPMPKAQPTAQTAFETRRKQAVRTLLDYVGPAGDGLAVKLERATTPEEFLVRLENASQIVSSIRGKTTGLEFYKRFSED